MKSWGIQVRRTPGTNNQPCDGLRHGLATVVIDSAAIDLASEQKRAVSEGQQRLLGHGGDSAGMYHTRIRGTGVLEGEMRGCQQVIRQMRNGTTPARGTRLDPMHIRVTPTLLLRRPELQAVHVSKPRDLGSCANLRGRSKQRVEIPIFIHAPIHLGGIHGDIAAEVGGRLQKSIMNDANSPRIHHIGSRQGGRLLSVLTTEHHPLVCLDTQVRQPRCRMVDQPLLSRKEAEIRGLGQGQLVESVGE
mmetsp:Transcript_20251/g.44915  ORF Transcript_20251/g.44915 Transcript_20251/m.44915 type:complete len:247 (+) Transcript_20251:603-1343(+)